MIYYIKIGRVFDVYVKQNFMWVKFIDVVWKDF